MKDKVTRWLRGQLPLQSIVNKLKKQQLTIFPAEELLEAIRMFAILAMCPSVSAKFASAFSRTRSHKRNISQKMVIVIKKFNEHRQHVLKKIYECVPHCRASYRVIFETIEQCSHVECTLVHRGGEGKWAPYASEILLTCSKSSSNKRSWIVPRDSVDMFHAFFMLRHLHSQIEISVFWWLKEKKMTAEGLDFETLLAASLTFMQSNMVQSITESYQKSFKVLQRVLLNYI